MENQDEKVDRVPIVEKLSEVGQPILENTQENKTDSDSTSRNVPRQDIQRSRNTHYETLKHPNMELSDQHSDADQQNQFDRLLLDKNDQGRG